MSIEQSAAMPALQRTENVSLADPGCRTDASAARWSDRESPRGSKSATDVRGEGGRNLSTTVVCYTEFMRRLDAIIGLLQACDYSRHTLLYLELDSFRLDDQARDNSTDHTLILEVGELFARNLRRADTLGYLGEGNFAVLLEHCPLEYASQVANAFSDAINTFHFNNTKEHPGISICLTSLTPESGDAASALAAGKDTCREAKESGASRICVQPESDLDLAKRQEQIRWIPRIHDALSENRFQLYQQSIFPIGKDSYYTDYREILLRLVDEQGRLIAPGAFIPAAERFNVMSAVDRWVVQTTFAHIAKTSKPKAGQPLGIWSINLSNLSLSDDFSCFVREQFDKHDVAPEAICFEVTEPKTAPGLRNSIRFIEDLRSLNCLFALDDVGSGLCSLTHLKQLPLDFMKIDGHAIKAGMANAIDCTLVESTIAIAQRMGMHTIAEGVDGPDVFEWVQRIGVDYAQGYSLEGPRPIVSQDDV